MELIFSENNFFQHKCDLCCVGLLFPGNQYQTVLSGVIYFSLSCTIDVSVPNATGSIYLGQCLCCSPQGTKLSIKAVYDACIYFYLFIFTSIKSIFLEESKFLKDNFIL